MAGDGYSADTAFVWPGVETRVVGNTATRPSGFPGIGMDWWRVRLRAGRAYRAQLRRPSFGVESSGQRYLSIYNSLPNAQGNNYWSRSYRYGEDGTYFPSIDWTPSGSGMTEWWIKVDDGNSGFNGYRGEYTLEITPAPAAWPSMHVVAGGGLGEVRGNHANAIRYSDGGSDEKGIHAILREGSGALTQHVRANSYAPVKPLAIADRHALNRETIRRVFTEGVHAVEALTGTALIYAEAITGFDDLQNPRDAHLVAAWTMDEAAGDRRDESPAKRALCEIGSVGAAEGISGNAADLSGSQDDYFEIANPFHDTPDTEGAISFWLRPDYNTSRVVLAGGQGSTDQWDFILYNSGNLYWRWMNSGNSSVQVEQNCANAPTGTWTHIALRWNGTLWEIFRNGALQSNRTTSGFDMRLGEYWRLGGRFDWNAWSGYSAYDGLLDEVYVWRRALTNDEISRLYANGEGLFIDQRAAMEPVGGFHRIIEKRRAALPQTWALEPRGKVSINHAAAWRIIDGVFMPYAASRHSLLHPKRHRLFARDTATGTEHDLGHAEEIPDTPGTFALPDVPLPDGVYEVEVRSTDAYWTDARSRRVSTFRLRAGEEPTLELPAVVNLRATMTPDYWRILEWSVANDAAGGTAYSFGLWFGDDAPVDLQGPPSAIITRTPELEHYTHYFQQAAPRYASVAAFTPEGGRGQPAEAYLDWSSERPASPEHQWAEENSANAATGITA